MKKNMDVLFAGVVGSIAVFGIIAMRNYMKNKNYKRDYNDHHKLFGSKPKKHYYDYGDSIEINAFL